MADPIFEVLRVHRRPAGPKDNSKGVLAYLKVELPGLVLDGLALRQSAFGKVYVSFPARVTEDGTRRYLVRPSDEQARRALEEEILHKLGEAE